jgi:hypothetical protein
LFSDKKKYILYRVVDGATDVSSGVTLLGNDMRSPYTGNITAVWAYNDTAGVTGTAVYDIHKNGVTIMDTTKISIETTELHSKDATTQPVISTAAIAQHDILTFMCDTAQTTKAKGLTFMIEITL